jgi:tetratricopeptide (TPR) repeat protein
MESSRRRRFARAWRAALIAVCLGSISLESSAQPAAPAPAPSPASEPALAEARARYQEGAQAYTEGRYKDAIDLFLDADRIRPSAALSFNIARAYEKLRDASGALRWYRDYFRRTDKPEDREQVQLRIGALQELLRQKGVQQVTILSEPPGATVVVDRRPMGVTPWTGDLTPGAHHLELRLRGYGDAESEFELPAARAVDVRVALVQDAPSAEPVLPRPTPWQPAPDVTTPERSWSRKTWGFVALGAAGAAFGGALTFELLRRSAEQDARNERVQIEFRDAVERMESRRTAARIFAGAGAALAVTGGALIAIDLLRDSKHQQRAARTDFELRCTPSACNANWLRRF